MKGLNAVFLSLTLSVSCGSVHSKLLNVLSDFLLQSNSSNFRSIFHPPSFTELASRYGHPAETHQVTTKDGYILTLFRIPGNGNAPPVLLCHGILDSSDTWIIRGEGSLSINLAKRKHDVWLLNTRGNKYSKRHVYLDAGSDPSYWDFTFNEMALYDVADTIDYILGKTGATKVNFVGHSQGNTVIWALLSTKMQYNHKVNVATALAPIAYVKHTLPPFKTLVQLTEVLYPLLRGVGVTSLCTERSVETIAFRVISQIPILGYLIDAYGILFQLLGTDSAELEPGFLPTAGLHFPNGNSVKDLVHFAQLFRSGQFARYDYGEAGNLAAYNTTTPSVYELGKITSKVVLVAALNDKPSQIADVERLRQELPNVVRFVISPRTIMNHIDHVWGKTAVNYLFSYIYDALENYN